ncbi:hypothetical protein, partial [Acinetobacter baumannii]|uniref:hypothetical protein n=1 Tax=Acinetobacter baumannii TaxID=470 RepID=UPI0038CD4A47
SKLTLFYLKLIQHHPEQTHSLRPIQFECNVHVVVTLTVLLVLKPAQMTIYQNHLTQMNF